MTIDSSATPLSVVLAIETERNHKGSHMKSNEEKNKLKFPDRVIITDVDDVLLQWGTGFREFMEDKGYTEKPGTEHHYRLAERYDGIADDDIFDLVMELNTSERMAHLKPVPGAVEAVQRLHADGFKFICVTAMSDRPESRPLRERNLDTVFGPGVFDHSQMICLRPDSSKYHSLKTWAGSGLFWLEDHFRHAESGHELGLKSVLIDTPYNRKYQTDLFPRAMNWPEIYTIITKAYGIENMHNTVKPLGSPGDLSFLGEAIDTATDFLAVDVFLDVLKDL